ncbi:hypothetical protein F2Q70_00001603 [Brassica cretica]|uniref:Uncharacterized protein n=1 Tax=Brassica cretica TaxID=69181 RepID=A0A8S9IYQ4_BRACR|nr:hypothetical protein F2Q70_00001603 [Brassica cretica]
MKNLLKQNLTWSTKEVEYNDGAKSSAELSEASSTRGVDRSRGNERKRETLEREWEIASDLFTQPKRHELELLVKDAWANVGGSTRGLMRRGDWRSLFCSITELPQTKLLKSATLDCSLLKVEAERTDPEAGGEEGGYKSILVLFSNFFLIEVREEETSKKKRRLLKKKKKCRRRLVFAVVTDIELVVVAIYNRRRHPCCRFSDPSSPVSVFTVVATTTACYHTEELGGEGGNKTVVFLEDVRALVVTGLRRRRKKKIMTLRLRDVEETYGDLVRFRFC